VLLAALVATGAIALSASFYLNWKIENSSCRENLPKVGADRVAESALKKFAGDIQASPPVRDTTLLGTFQFEQKGAHSSTPGVSRGRSIWASFIVF
jgi:hypothetical protein